MADTLTLYTYFRSSCSARVRIVLNIKGVSYERKYVNILIGEQALSEYDEVNPSHFVPSLKLPNGTILTQSLAIMEYLEEAYPDTSRLLPSDALGRAQVRALAEIVACDIQPVTNLRILSRISALGGAKEQYAKELMTEGLSAYERLAAKTAGKYSYGDQVTMADASLVPAVWGAVRFGVDIEQFPTIKRVFEELSKLDAVVKAHWKTQEDTPQELRG
jgi:maleylacetoacetate isomerase